jgi:uncharacterized repeat protein (TIGR03803 family)
MAAPRQGAASIFDINLRGKTIAPACALMFAMTILAGPAAQAQTFTVLHSFSGADGAGPEAHLTLDNAGNIYGTASSDGDNDGGTAFKLSKRNGSWIFAVLHDLYQNPVDDAAHGMIFAPGGILYGSTRSAGGLGLGTIFGLRPPATFCASVSCPWTETVIYPFQGGSDGCGPGDIIFDHTGNIFGAASDNLCASWGTVYELTPSGGNWTNNLLYTFSGQDGALPADAALAMDTSGNLYGTTDYTRGSGFSYYGFGTVYQLANSGSGWTHTTLHTFTDTPDGAYPEGGVIVDGSGDLFGVTPRGGDFAAGTVFELTPGSGNWAFNIIYSFTGVAGCGPSAPLTMDSAGNLYGVTSCGGDYGRGTVFKLAPSGPGWIYSTLYAFTGGSDGSHPSAGVVLDASGNIYGTARGGGNHNDCNGEGCGVVWEITP